MADFQDVIWVGEGWRSLIEECHEQLLLAFPNYELTGITAEEGLLAFRASPGPSGKGGRRSIAEETTILEAITATTRERSGTVCEWCGGNGFPRSSRKQVLTLCDDCDASFSDPPDMAKDNKERATH